MELLKKFFKDDEKVIGLCAFQKKEETKPLSFTPQFSAIKLVCGTNTKKNFFIN